MSEFEPFIVVIACNWCTYTGCDQAGTSRMQRPPNVRILRVMCSARAEMSMAVKLLKEGADAVIFGACHIGDCHYLTGNHSAVRRAAVGRKYIEQFGFNRKRFDLWHISASEGAEFTERMTEFVEEIRKIGPNPRKKKLEGGN